MAGAALLRHLGPRLFAVEPVTGLAARGVMPAAARILPARMSSTAAEAAKEAAAPQQRQKPEAAAPEGQNKQGIVSYWGIEPRKLVKEDGTEWTWFCFRVSTRSALPPLRICNRASRVNSALHCTARAGSKICDGRRLIVCFFVDSYTCSHGTRIERTRRST